MFSVRFQRPVILTRHTVQRMAERKIDPAQLISYADDGTVVETVILEAAKRGAWPLHVEHRDAA